MSLVNQPTITQQGTPEQEKTIDSDRSEPRRAHTNILSSRDPSGNGTEYHLQTVIDAGSLEHFKVRLNSIPWPSSQHR
jgi:hypothetical protein